MKNKLLPIMGNWKKSGNGSCAKSEEAPYYDDGNDDADLVDGAMKITYVHSNYYHVFYFWCCLEQEGVLDFTLSRNRPGRAVQPPKVLNRVSACENRLFSGDVQTRTYTSRCVNNDRKNI